MAELKYKDITEKIIGSSFEVHKFLGNGFQEVIYQHALAWELTQACAPCSSFELSEGLSIRGRLINQLWKQKPYL
jgi:GxxExxY protein